MPFRAVAAGSRLQPMRTLQAICPDFTIRVYSLSDGTNCGGREAIMNGRFIIKLGVQMSLVTAAVGILLVAQQSKGPATSSLRLYVFDCGTLHPDNAGGYSLKNEEVAELRMSVPCFLVAHPRGILFWDTGIIPEA